MEGAQLRAILGIPEAAVAEATETTPLPPGVL